MAWKSGATHNFALPFMAKRGRPKKVLPTSIPVWTVSLRLSGDTKEYKGEGETLTLALQKMNRPAFFTAKAWITATDGKKKAEIWMMPNKLKQFMRPAFLRFQANRLQALVR